VRRTWQVANAVCSVSFWLSVLVVIYFARGAEYVFSLWWVRLWVSFVYGVVRFVWRFTGGPVLQTVGRLWGLDEAGTEGTAPFFGESGWVCKNGWWVRRD
jgi:hypothetical protein